ncbi:hypothetical protein CHU98_g6663 [Xylaria longipes]|nr:hypothetical protein CHU98_g6663 [Xylaria longipes]
MTLALGAHVCVKNLEGETIDNDDGVNIRSSNTRCESEGHTYAAPGPALVVEDMTTDPAHWVLQPKPARRCSSARLLEVRLVTSPHRQGSDATTTTGSRIRTAARDFLAQAPDPDTANVLQISERNYGNGIWEIEPYIGFCRIQFCWDSVFAGSEHDDGK